MRIVFMGTPEFAIPSLQSILESHHEVVAVVTAPDAMGGRGGHQLIQSEIKKYALSKGLFILQPEKLREKAFIQQLRDLKADLQVVVAFRMLPEMVWNMPPLGTINVHGSLLPKYRGAAPIHWAVIHGEKNTGVTIFRLKHEIDSGDIIQQTSIPIGPDESTGDVYHRLMWTGASTLIESLKEIETGNLKLIPQNPLLSSPAPKLFHQDAVLDFNQSSLQLHNFIRGHSPHPTAWMVYHNLKFLFFRTHLPETLPPAAEPGRLQIIGRKLYLHAIDGAIEILELQQEGKKKMAASDFINGMKNNILFK